MGHFLQIWDKWGDFGRKTSKNATKTTALRKYTTGGPILDVKSCKLCDFRGFSRENTVFTHFLPQNTSKYSYNYLISIKFYLLAPHLTSQHLLFTSQAPVLPQISSSSDQSKTHPKHLFEIIVCRSFYIRCFTCLLKRRFLFMEL